MPSSLTIAKDRRRRKLITVAWIAILTGITVFLLYKEMIALLYILATLGVTALLTVVGMSDLSAREASSPDTLALNDSAAIGSGIISVAGKNKT